MPGTSAQGGEKCSYMRAAFSVAALEDFDVAFARLSQLIREEAEKK